MSGRSYLGTKSYHPSSQKNQAKVWQAEQASQLTAKREAERRALLEKERRALDAAHSEAEVARESVSFLYRAPPGYFRDREAEERADRQRKLENPSLLTLKDKFPDIKNAPMASDVAKSMDIRVNMLGKVLRNVQCTKCHAWGHKGTDRECPMRDVLLPADIERRDREDPMRAFQATADEPRPANGLILKEEIVIRGGGVADHENQQLLSPGDDEDDDADGGGGSDPETAFLKQLSAEQRTALLKELKRDRKRKRRKQHESSSSSHSRKRKRQRSPSLEPKPH